MKRIIVGSLTVLTVFLFVSIAAAGPIPVSPATAPGAPSMGESDLANGSSTSGAPGARTPNVDWMVIHPDDAFAEVWEAAFPGVVKEGDYIYLYQAENDNTPGKLTGPVGKKVPSGETMATLHVTVPGGSVTAAGTLLTKGGVVTMGDADGDDLDKATPFHPAHVIGKVVPADDGTEDNAGEPAGEEEGICPAGDFAGDSGATDGKTTGTGSGYCINPDDPIITTIDKTDVKTWTVEWRFDPQKPPHHETVTLWYVSPFAPTYGIGSMQNSITWETGNTVDHGNNKGFVGDFVPVPMPPPPPIPEPSTTLLFGIGLASVFAWRRKRGQLSKF